MTTAKNNLTREQKIANFLKTLDCENIDLPYFAENDQRDYQDLYSAIEEGDGFNVEIIYYSKAIEYLSENDPSLRNSLEIASEMGFDLKSLSSETLASLLATQNAREAFNELESEIEDFFTELNEQEEQEEEEEETPPTKLTVKDGPNTWYLTYCDSTHFFLSNSEEFKGSAYHIGQIKTASYYEQVNTWLKSHNAKN